jgi:cytochrome b pre-mRNA-processing protein 3
MLNWLKERQSRTRTAQELYGSIVAQARQPAFYAALAMPDTARGRFEVIALHVAIVLHRLGTEGASAAGLARSLSETFITDVDDNIREMSFSDLAVPREIKKAAAALFDRHTAVALPGPAPESGPDPLAERLAAQLAYLAPADQDTPIDSAALARYTRAALALLATQPAADLIEQGPRWPAITS